MVLWYWDGGLRETRPPYGPADVSRELNTWENSFSAGERLKRRIAGTCLLADVNSVLAVQQGSKRYVDKDRNFIGDLGKGAIR